MGHEEEEYMPLPPQPPHIEGAIMAVLAGAATIFLVYLIG
jgi:hypothetical protein